MSRHVILSPIFHMSLREKWHLKLVIPAMSSEYQYLALSLGQNDVAELWWGQQLDILKAPYFLAVSLSIKSHCVSRTVVSSRPTWAVLKKPTEANHIT